MRFWYCMPDDADDELYVVNSERELAEGNAMNILKIIAKPCEESTRTSDDPACSSSASSYLKGKYLEIFSFNNRPNFEAAINGENSILQSFEHLG